MVYVKKKRIVVVGAGPSGLGCVDQLVRVNRLNIASIIILDKNDRVGGLARTYRFRNLFFDVGPHRFYTKNAEILRLWKRILGGRFFRVKRITSILYNHRFFAYPLRVGDMLHKLGLMELIKCLWGYVRARFMSGNMPLSTFEEWVVKHFGKRLYEIFFKTYTEKIWGIPCNQISAKWASQRIKNLNIPELIFTLIFRKAPKARSLVDYFYYPIQGSGFLYEEWSKQLQSHGAMFSLNSEVVSIVHDHGRVTAIEYVHGAKHTRLPVDYVFSSMPVTKLIESLTPKPPRRIRQAARALYYRDHITVNLCVRGPSPFPDQWIYVHSPNVLMARISNYGNFAKQSNMHATVHAIAVEYFVFSNDPLWKMTDAKIIEFAIKEIHMLNLMVKNEIADGFVIRETESYPVYYLDHENEFAILKEYINAFSNLLSIGRAGMYKYNNMDHAIISGMQAANSMIGNQVFSWGEKKDSTYLEE